MNKWDAKLCFILLRRLLVRNPDMFLIIVIKVNRVRDKWVTRGGPPSWGLGEVLTTQHCKTGIITKHKQVPRTRTDPLIRPT